MPVSTFAFEDIPIRMVRLIAEFTKASQAGLAALDWGLDTAILLGSLDDVASSLDAHETDHLLLVIQLFDGRKVLVSGRQSDIEHLKTIDYLEDERDGPSGGGAFEQQTRQAEASGGGGAWARNLPCQPFTHSVRRPVASRDLSTSFGRRGS